MYRIYLNAKAQKDFKKLPLHISEAVERVLFGPFRENPFARTLDVTKLQVPLEGYRLRVGEYRVLYDIEDNSVLIYSIKHRKDAYR